ncbi:hypothetical protein ACFQJ7_04580 [Halovenus rubra]|uniref:Uncharacterized protein n=2 Tax=Halovenus rubra TaxID=869890 RepID=A0ABD5X2J9_9EURY|nr:hypothetical protein [Halovenus rubra]
MTKQSNHQRYGPEQLSEYPDVDLDWAHSDTDDPTKLTIFDPATPHIAAAWITVDSEACCSLERAR